LNPHLDVRNEKIERSRIWALFFLPKRLKCCFGTITIHKIKGRAVLRKPKELGGLVISFLARFLMNQII